MWVLNPAFPALLGPPVGFALRLLGPSVGLVLQLVRSTVSFVTPACRLPQVKIKFSGRPAFESGA